MTSNVLRPLSVHVNIDGEYEPEKYGVPHIDNVDLDVLGLFTSRTDNFLV